MTRLHFITFRLAGNEIDSSNTERRSNNKLKSVSHEDCYL